MNVSVSMTENILQISDKESREALWSKSLDDFELDENLDTGLRAGERDNCKILFWKEMNDAGENVLMVYVRNRKIKASYACRDRAYLRVLPKECSVLEASLTEEGLYLKVSLAVSNKEGLVITNSRLVVGKRAERPFQMYQVTKRGVRFRVDSPDYVQEFFFSMEELTKQDVEENSSRVEVVLNVNGIEMNFPVKMEPDETLEPKYLAVPLVSFYYKDYAVQLKNTGVENLVFVCRPKNKQEKTLSFRFWESDKVSRYLYEKGKEEKEKSSQKVSLFYEKFCEKAEEGTFELFEMARRDNPKGAFYIINKNSPDYKKIKNKPNVVRQFSRKYYELLFRANAYISTETPIQVNMLQSNNIYFRKTIAENTFVFLQHGVTYMKCQGKYSPFLVGREMEPDYMIVNSEKEKRVVHEMIGIEQERILKTGMGIFDTVEYGHISEKSEDIAVLMLTWKQYEEDVRDFTKTSCFQYTMKIFELLRKYLPADNIKVVIHPKIKSAIANTPLTDYIWTGAISEILSRAKLLITDYSSVCYNSFYQGGSVIFYQEDLEFYEKTVGNLIPSAEEYIGRRAFSVEELEAMLKAGIKNQKIHLGYFRTKEFEENYRTINEFADGKNNRRIFEELKRLQIL